MRGIWRLVQKGRVMWRTAFLAAIWIIWEDAVSLAENLEDRLKIYYCFMGVYFPLFRDIPLDLIVRNWRQVTLPFVGS